MANFWVCSLTWKYRTKFEKSDFIFDPASKTDNLLPVDAMNEDEQMVNAFKNLIKKKGKKIRRFSSAFYLFLITMQIIVILLFLSLLLFKSFFLLVGLEELTRLFDSSSKSRFPIKKMCEVYDLRGGKQANTQREIIECTMPLNYLFLTGYLIIWFILIFMISFIFICFCSIFKMTSSNKNQLNRLKEILPSLDKNSLDYLASGTYSYFMIEELYFLLDKDKFERLMYLLVEENYSIGNELSNKADV